MLEQGENGDCVIRPSSKDNFLTLTWRVYQGIYQHVPIEEKDKEAVFSIGRTLVIGDDYFEDLDEVIARYVQPLAANAREIIQHKYFVEPPVSTQPADYQERRFAPMENFKYIEEHLRKRKQNESARIPYCFSPTHRQVGKFMLSYMPGSRARHEYVTPTHNGYRFRHRRNHQDFIDLNVMLRWFKEHFAEQPDNMQDPVQAEQRRLEALVLKQKEEQARKMQARTPGHYTQTGSATPSGFSEDLNRVFHEATFFSYRSTGQYNTWRHFSASHTRLAVGARSLWTTWLAKHTRYVCIALPAAGSASRQVRVSIFINKL